MRKPTPFLKSSRHLGIWERCWVPAESSQSQPSVNLVMSSWIFWKTGSAGTQVYKLKADVDLTRANRERLFGFFNFCFGDFFFPPGDEINLQRVIADINFILSVSCQSDTCQFVISIETEKLTVSATARVHIRKEISFKRRNRSVTVTTKQLNFGNK